MTINPTNIDDVLLKTAYQLTDADAIALNLHHYEGRGEMLEGLTAAQYAENPDQSNQSRNYFSGRRVDVSLRYTHQDEQNNFELLTYYTDSFRTSNLGTDQQRQDGTPFKRLDNAPRDYSILAIGPRFSRAYSIDNTQREVTLGYRYMDEDSTEFAVGTAYDFGQQFHGLKVGGGVKNVFDKQYFTRSSDATGGKYVGQPRTFYLQTSFDF